MRNNSTKQKVKNKFNFTSISLRSMAVLVGRANKKREGRETVRRLGREQLTFLARFAPEFLGFAARAPGSTKPPCYAG